MKELFESRKKEEDEENATSTFYKKFTNQGPAYFGDLDEGDGKLLMYEEEEEQTGNVSVRCWQLGQVAHHPSFRGGRVGGGTRSLA